MTKIKYQKKPQNQQNIDNQETMLEITQNIQLKNTCILSRDAIQMKEDNPGLKSLLAESNNDCWILRSSLTISRIKEMNEVFWRIRMQKRMRANSIEDK